MIFVTIGTHEQPFDRLVREVNRLKAQGIIKEEVFIQLGYSQYVPISCSYEQFLEYQEMEAKVREAHIVITHGGPGSIMLALYYGKIPIVVPRHHCYGEHVDDHQVKFTRKLEQKERILAIYKIEDLQEKIVNYDRLVQRLITSQQVEKATSAQRVSEFARKLDEICKNLLRRKVRGE